jgi:hypothetical protein
MKANMEKFGSEITDGIFGNSISAVLIRLYVVSRTRQPA